MSKLLKERWNRLAFSNGTTSILSEGRPEEDASPLAPLRDMGFYFAGADTVVLNDLDDMSGKEYSSSYPSDSYMGQGPFHVQVSVEDNGKFMIHDYSSVDDIFCTGTMPKEGVQYDSIEQVKSVLGEMVKCYEEFMDAYQEIDAADAVADEFYRYIDLKHPVTRGLMKK